MLRLGNWPHNSRGTLYRLSVGGLHNLAKSIRNGWRTGGTFLLYFHWGPLMREWVLRNRMRGIVVAGFAFALTGCDSSPSPAKIGTACFDEKIKGDQTLNKIVGECFSLCEETFAESKVGSEWRMKTSECAEALGKQSDPHSICTAGGAQRGTPDYEVCLKAAQ